MNLAANSRPQHTQARQYQQIPAVDYRAEINYSVRKNIDQTTSG
jgi:hypothetical protein